MNEGQAIAIDSDSVSMGALQTATRADSLLEPVGWGVTSSPSPVESSMADMDCRSEFASHIGPHWFIAFAVLLSSSVTRASAQDYERPPILYSQTAPQNSASELQSRLIDGISTLRHEPHFGRLRSLLNELQVPTSSQVLFFSKTSRQREHISLATPRAIYFNDNLYVGYCQGGAIMEVSQAWRATASRKCGHFGNSATAQGGELGRLQFDGPQGSIRYYGVPHSSQRSDRTHGSGPPSERALADCACRHPDAVSAAPGARAQPRVTTTTA